MLHLFVHSLNEGGNAGMVLNSDKREESSDEDEGDVMNVGVIVGFTVRNISVVFFHCS